MSVGRLLIAAGEAAAGPEKLPSGVRSLIEASEEILVIAPTLPGRFEWLASATDRAREQADDRLRTVLGHLEDLGAAAAGTVAPDDPLLAFEEAVADFDPDHVLICLRPSDRVGWQERGLLDQLVQRFGLPTTVFVAPR